MPKPKPIPKQEFAKSEANPEFEEFEEFVDMTRKTVRAVMDELKAKNDYTPSSISHYTNRTIKNLFRGAKWSP